MRAPSSKRLPAHGSQAVVSAAIAVSRAGCIVKVTRAPSVGPSIPVAGVPGAEELGELRERVAAIAARAAAELGDPGPSLFTGGEGRGLRERAQPRDPLRDRLIGHALGLGLGDGGGWHGTSRCSLAVEKR